MTTSLLNKTIHTKPKPSIPSNPLKLNNFLTQQNSLEKPKPSLSHEHTNSNNNPLPLSSPINALLPPVIQTKENTTCEILVADFEFRPKQARVKINSKVQWTIGENKTSHQSGIYSTENRNFVIGIPDFDEESDLLSRGQTFEFYFNKTGNFDVICSNYPRMQGKVEVYGDEEDIMFKKVQHEMKARGLLLSGKQFDEKFFGHNNHKPILASPPPKKIQEKYPSPYKNLEEAHSEEDSNVQELLQELNAKGPSIKSNKSKSKGGKRKGFEFGDERNTEELFKQLRSRSEASDDDDDIRNFSLDTSDAYRMSDNEEEDKDEELETKYNQILMSPSRFTIHEIMKMGAKLENSMIKKENLEEENKKSAQEREITIEPEAPINQGDILIEIRQELENNDHEEEKLKDTVVPPSEKEVVVNLDGEQEKENLNEKPKKKNKNKKKKKKKAAAGAGAKDPTDPSVENTPTSVQDKEVVIINSIVEDKKEVNNVSEVKLIETNKKATAQIVAEPKTENKQPEKPKDSPRETQNKPENKNNEKENKNAVVTKTAEIISKPLIEEQKFQTVIPSSNVKDTKNQNPKEVEIGKNKADNNKKGASSIEKTPKASAPVQQQVSSQKITEEAKSHQSQVTSAPTVTNEKPKDQNLMEDLKNVVNNNKAETNNKKKKKKNNKKNKELNKQNSLPSEPKTEAQSLEKLETPETTETPQDLTSISPTLPLKEAIPFTPETSEATSSEEKEPALLGNEALLAFLKDAVKPEASKYQKSFRSNKSKNKKAQKEIDYSEEDDRIAALSAFLSNRYEYAEAFN